MRLVEHLEQAGHRDEAPPAIGGAARTCRRSGTGDGARRNECDLARRARSASSSAKATTRAEVRSAPLMSRRSLTLAHNAESDKPAASLPKGDVTSALAGGEKAVLQSLSTGMSSFR
jgi:hypothetical protein